MNSAPGSVSSEPHPPRYPAIALRPKSGGRSGSTSRCESRCCRANRTTQIAKRDIWDIGGPHTGLIGLTGPWGRCTQALNPRKEPRIQHRRKPEKPCHIKHLNRGGGGGIRTHGAPKRTTVFEFDDGRTRLCQNMTLGHVWCPGPTSLIPVHAVL